MIFELSEDEDKGFMKTGYEEWKKLLPERLKTEVLLPEEVNMHIPIVPAAHHSIQQISSYKIDEGQ